MSASLAPYNVSLTAASPLFEYAPSRHGDVLRTWNAVSSVGVGHRRTEFSGATVSLSFEGDGLFICFSANDAKFTLTLDGETVDQTAGQIVPASSDTGPCKGLVVQSMFAAAGLKHQTHDMLLNVTEAGPNKEFQFFGGTITLGVDTKGGKVKDSRIVDDQDPGWSLSDGRKEKGEDSYGWETIRSSTLLNTTGTVQCSYFQQSTASYKFSGASGVIFRGYVWEDSHSFSVYLDREMVNMDATSSGEDGSTVFLARGNLDPAVSHTITVLNYNFNDGTCASSHGPCCVGLDALILLEAGSKSDTDAGGTKPDDSDTVPSPTSAASPRSIAGPVAGAVVGGLALIGIVLFALLFYRRRKKRRAIVLAAASEDDNQFVAQQPQAGDTDYGMRYNGPDSKGVILSSPGISAPPRSAAVPVGRPGEKPLPLESPSYTAAPAAETRHPAEGGPSGLSPADLERVLSFVARRLDRPRQAAPAQLEEHPPQYQG